MKEFRLNVPPKRLKNSIRIVKMQYLTPQLDQSDMHGNSSIYDFSTSFKDVVFFKDNIVNSFSLFQPIDVSHIYRADLDETQQKRLPKKSNTKTTSEVRSKIALQYDNC